jgi:hypothetical protein
MTDGISKEIFIRTNSKMLNVKLSTFTILLVLVLIWPSSVLGDIIYTFHLDGVDQSIRTQIENSVTEAVALYNQHGSFNKSLNIYYNSGVPTAEANYDGVITFGGSRNTRVALHETAHTVGCGTYGAWGGHLSGGIWTGAYATSKIKEFDGQDALLHGDSMHFWPYGLNYDTEDGFINRICHIKIVAALLCDMGILSFAQEPTGQVVQSGDTAVFNVDAVGVQSYRWYKQGNPNPLTNGGDISGAYSDTLQIANVDILDEGLYYCVVSATGVSPLSSRPAILMTQRFFGHWRFDGDANDSIGSNHGTAWGSPVYTTGKIGLAIDLDGTNDYVTLPAGVADTYDITVTAWVYWDGGNQWQRIFDFGTGTNQYLFLTPRSGSNTLRFAIKNGGSEQIVETTQLATGQWVHVAVTLRDSAATLYVNGAVAATNSSVTINPIDFKPTINYIGDSQWSAHPFFNGRIDDFRIYNYALPGSEIWIMWGESTDNPPLFTSDPIIKPDATEEVGYSGQSLATDANDPDSGTLIFSKVTGPSWLNVAANGTLSGTPGNDDVGENIFFVRVTDPAGASDDATLKITVVNTNDAPFWLANPFSKDSVTQGQSYSGSLAEDVDDIDAGDTLTFSKISGPAWLNVAADGTLSGTPGAGNVGVNSFTVHVTDNSGASDDATLNITVLGIELITQYKFDGNANDSIGANHGTAVGGPLYTTGKIGQAIDLDAVNDYVVLPAGLVNIDDTTIAAWVNWDGGNQWQRIFDFGNNTSQYMFLSPRSGGDTLRFAITTSSYGSEQILQTTQLATSQWVHIAVTLAGNVGKLYVGGVLKATNSSMTLNPSDFNPAINYIGKSQWSADPLFNGRIDDFRIYNYALPAADIATLAGGAANNPPSFTSDPISNLDATEDAAYVGQPLVLYAVDLDGGTLTFSKVAGPDWLSVASDGSLSGTPSDSDTGENVFTVRVQDQGGLSDTAGMTIDVANIYSGVRGMEDLAGLAERWLMQDCADTPPCNGADLNGDTNVNLSDLAELAGNWQTGI